MLRRKEPRERVQDFTGDLMLAKREAGYSVAWIAAFHGYSRQDTARAIRLARKRRDRKL